MTPEGIEGAVAAKQLRAAQADAVRRRATQDGQRRRRDRVLDLDIRAFFDTVDHDLLIKAVEANTDAALVVLYVKRWLRAPLALPDGTLHARDRGTPQGSSVSPVLANLFLHYAFDAWMDREHPGVAFARYVDDVVVHADSQRQAERLRASIAARMVEVGLELHPDKTRIVYCRDDRRRGGHEHISFTFLGYEFRPRMAKARNGNIFFSFLAAVSRAALTAMGRRLRSWRLHRQTGATAADLAGVRRGKRRPLRPRTATAGDQ
jgi:RNA-directed DNA polymerase